MLSKYEKEYQMPESFTPRKTVKLPFGKVLLVILIAGVVVAFAITFINLYDTAVHL